MFRPVDPTRLIGRSVLVDTEFGERQASVRTVGPAGVSLDVEGEAVLVLTGEVDRMRPV